MVDVFRGLDFLIIYIDDLLVFSRNIQEHHKHLHIFYENCYKHGLALSKTKMEIGKTTIEFMGLKVDA